MNPDQHNELDTKIQHWIDIINKSLEEFVREKQIPQAKIYEAMRYSLLAGGKRIRPVIMLAVCEMLQGDVNEAIPFACAIEMIHTYSLIHDDLPSMDDDDYRRGRLTNHKVYGEAIAVLAGDALLNKAHEILLDAIAQAKDNMQRKACAARVISASAGTEGMIGGQVVDLESEGKQISEELLLYMHKNKTGALLKAPAMAAAELCGASEEEKQCISGFAEKLGIAFQIRDDILDVEGSLDSMGKQAGPDEKKGKSTYVSLYGLEEAKIRLTEVSDQAVDCLKSFGDRAKLLKSLVERLAIRES